MDDECKLSEAACQTDLEGSVLSASQKELQRLLEENRTLKEQLANSNKFDEGFFKDNDENVKHYTGLPSFAILVALFNFLEVYRPIPHIVEQFN